MIVVFVSGETSLGGEKFMADWAFYVPVFTLKARVHLEVQELERVWRRGRGNMKRIGDISVIGIFV